MDSLLNFFLNFLEEFFHIPLFSSQSGLGYCRCYDLMTNVTSDLVGEGSVGGI